jgi:hypothetical protein
MTFDEWLYETENFSLRLERLLEELPVENCGTLIKWLNAAYDAGFEQSESRFVDDGK